MHLHPFLVYGAAAGLLFALLRLSRLRPSGFATSVLFLLGLGYPAWLHLDGRRFAPLDLLFVISEPWRSVREAMGVHWTSAGVTGDLWQLFVPWARVVRTCWEAGVWPLWTSRYLSGTVLLGAGQAAPFAPDQLLMLATSFEDGFTVAAAFVLLTAALGAFLYARELELPEEAALVAAACWAFSSYHFFWVGWRHGAAGGLFPLVLLGVRRVARTPSLGAFLLLAAAFALVALCGHPETLLHTTIAAAVAFVLELATARPLLAARELAGRFAVAGVAGLFAFALAAVALVPIIDVLPQTTAWHERHGWAAGERPLPSLRRSADAAVGSLVPYVHGVVGKETPEGKLPTESFSTGYIGSLGLALAAIGLVGSRHRVRWPLLLLGGLAIAGASKFAPAELLIRRVPLLNVAVNERLVFVAGAAFSILAAFGFAVLVRARDAGLDVGESRARARGAALARWLPLVALGGVVLLWRPLEASGLSDRFLGGQSLLYVAPLLALLLPAPLGRRVRVALLVVLAAVVAQRLGESAHFHAGTDRAAFDLRVAPLDQLPQVAPAPYRVVGVGDLLHPNSTALVDLDDVRGYEAVYLARYVDTYPLWSAEYRESWYPRVESLSSPFLDFLAVRWALDVPGSDPPAGWSPVRQHGLEWRLLENHEALPLAFAPAEVRRVASSEGTVAAMASVESFARIAWIESAVAAGDLVSGANAQGQVAIEERAPGHYRIRTELDREGWVVTSIPAWRGWRARAGGRLLETAFANHAFVAIRAPGGAAEIDLVYSPRSFWIGLWASLLAAVAWLALGWRWLAIRPRLAVASPQPEVPKVVVVSALASR